MNFLSLLLIFKNMEMLKGKKTYTYTYTYRMTTPPWGLSGPVQLNWIGRMHVKAPLAAANGHE